MKTINPAYQQAICKLVCEAPYPGLLSMQLTQLEIGEATVEIKETEKKHTQPYQVVHGGVIASLIDTATFWAVFLDLDEGCGLTTVDLKLNYLAPVVSGKLIAKGKSIKMGKRLGYSEATVFCHDKIVAHGTSTLMVLPGKALSQNLPEKYSP